MLLLYVPSLHFLRHSWFPDDESYWLWCRLDFSSSANMRLIFMLPRAAHILYLSSDIYCLNWHKQGIFVMFRWGKKTFLPVTNFINAEWLRWSGEAIGGQGINVLDWGVPSTLMFSRVVWKGVTAEYQTIYMLWGSSWAERWPAGSCGLNSSSGATFTVFVLITVQIVLSLATFPLISVNMWSGTQTAGSASRRRSIATCPFFTHNALLRSGGRGGGEMEG